MISSVAIAAVVKPAVTPLTAPADENMYSENKTNIVVLPKQPEFTIKLKSNATTGYSWVLREYDANLISPVKHSYVAGTTGLIGAPGYEYFVFKVKPLAFTVPHETTIRLFYDRPWENTDSGAMVVFRVTTQGM